MAKRAKDQNIVLSAEDSKPDETRKASDLRDERGRFLKGRPSAPGPGRPKGLPGIIREVAGDLSDVARRMYEISQGDHGATIQNQIDAAKWLHDRLYGRAVETTVQVQLDQDSAHEAVALSAGALEDIARELTSGPIVEGRVLRSGSLEGSQHPEPELKPPELEEDSSEG